MNQETGIAFYHRDQWDKVRRYSKDRKNMEPLYDDWLLGAERAVKEMESRGVTVHRVYIDVDMLIAWAKRKRMKIDSNTRTSYTNYLLANRHNLTDDI